ncbi:MAG: hypothetical protein E7485_08540 [Ruminococcaceae bacterium]|nr:hypothetical protein [Oscillospiraceae bacterium]
MDISHEEQLREEFRKILIDLAQHQTSLDERKKRSEYYIRLESLYYDNKFRHYYSDVFSVLNAVHKGDINGDINILGQNLDLLRKGYQTLNPDPNSPDGVNKDISMNIQKLYDHVNLDISRILSGDANSWRLLQENKISQLNKKIKTSEEKLQNIEGKMESAQKEYISILGLFATIVLAFIGSIVFSTSVLENMHKSSVYRVILVILLIAFTLINVIYLIFRLIDKIVSRDNKKVNAKPLVISDAVIVVLIFGVILAWYCGAVEKRNEAINNSAISSEPTVSNVTIETEEEYETTEATSHVNINDP